MVQAATHLPEPRGDALPGPGRRSVHRAAAAASALTFAAFLPTLGNGFVETWDDGTYVLYNEHLRDLSLATVRWAFGSFHAHFWAPLTWLSLALDHAVFGLEPRGYHLTNALCHALSAGLVLALAHALLSAPGSGLASPRARLWAAALAALLWSLHPLRVESVAWVTERKDVLSGLLGIAAVLAYVRHAEGAARPFWRSGAHWAALGLGALSLAAKPALATLPAVLLLLDWVPLGRFGREGAWTLLLEKAPWILLGAISTVLTAVGFVGTYMPLAQSGVGSSVLVALRAAWEYLRLIAWPAGLSPFHLHPGEVSPADPAFLVPAAAVVALAAAAVLGARRWPRSAAAFLAFLALVAPGLASARTGVTGWADRFTYLPAIPLSVLAAGGLSRALEGRPARLRAVAGAGAVLALAVLAALTIRQAGFWRDDVALWSRAIALRPHVSGRMYSERALAYELRGDWQRARADVDEAIAIAAAKRYGQMEELYAQRARIDARLGGVPDAAATTGASPAPPGAAPPAAPARP